MIGGRAAEGGASAGFGPRDPRRHPLVSEAHAQRAPGPKGKPRPRRGRVEYLPSRANPLTKESPALLPLARPPPAPALFQSIGLRAQPKGKRIQKGRPRHLQSAGMARATRGPICWQGSAVWCAACIALGSSSATKDCPNITSKSAPFEHSSLKSSTFLVSQGNCSCSETKLLEKL
jgi:hypothetical protein